MIFWIDNSLSDMPAAVEITHIDRYIMWAYLCLTLLIVEVAVANLLHVGIYTEYGEMIMMIFLIIMWLGGSLWIIILPWRRSTKIDWEKLSDMEMEEWDQHKNAFLRVDKNHMHGTQIMQ